MREILFRGKRADNGEWVYGVPTKDEHGEMVVIESIFECDEYACRGAKCLYVDETTVGQYTGLKDKNGKKIFEGDIVLYCGEKRKVYYNNGQFGLFIDGNIFDSFNFAFCYQLEIIGNIHDNPELLEVEEK